MAQIERKALIKQYKETKQPAGVYRVCNIQSAKEDSLFTYINLAQRHRLLSEKEATTAHAIRNFANKVLHVKESPLVPTEANTFDVVRNTMSILQKLYR
jgi:hypothetical protein